jgi:hypothetical protein
VKVYTLPLGNKFRKKEVRPNKQAVIKATIVLVDRSVLHIREYIDAKYKIEKVSYAYQYQDFQASQPYASLPILL